MKLLILEQAIIDLKELLSSIHNKIGESIVSDINQIFHKYNMPLPVKIENYIHRKTNDTNELITIIKILIKMLEEQIIEKQKNVINSKCTSQPQINIEQTERIIHR